MKKINYIAYLTLVTTLFSYSAHFEIDTNDIPYPNEDYSSVVINGSWNDWSEWGVNLLDNDGDGIYTGTLGNLSDGQSLEYVIAFTGPTDNWSGWGHTVNAPMGSSCDWNPDDQFANYGLQIQGADAEEIYCAGTCEEMCENSGDGGGSDGGGDDQIYALVWSDEFDENEIDETKWNFEIGTGNGGWGNGEEQYYTSRSENAFIEDGKLIIQALNESYAGSNYTSAKMTTENKADFLYGKIVASIKVPEAGGTWPAFWMLPTNSVYGGWPNSGEMDIMEHYGCDPGHVHSTVHNNTYNWAGGIPPTGYNIYTNATSEFLEYEMEWSDDELSFSVDGNWIGSYYNENSGSSQWPYDQEFYVILNLAIGSYFMACETEGNLFPQRYEIDYVRVYQLTDEFVVDLYGDVTQDGELNVLDVVLMVSFALNDSEPSFEQSLISDMNQDGAFDILDIVELVSILI